MEKVENGMVIAAGAAMTCPPLGATRQKATMSH